MGEFRKALTEKPMLEIKNLHVTIGSKEIIKGLNLVVKPGEVHAIMGPNGSGKSTLAKVIAGDENYEVTAGTILFKGKNIAKMSPEERALEGVFMAFQYPIEIPGVNNAAFLRMAYNAKMKHLGKDEIDPFLFDAILRDKLKLVEMSSDFSSRSVNHGFSGGEKKRNEIVQMAVLEPGLAILDETDSGLDIDALRIVAKGINALRRPTNAAILITHYQRLLEYIDPVPDHVHIFQDGRIVKTGGMQIVEDLEREGYKFFADAGAIK